MLKKLQHKVIDLPILKYLKLRLFENQKEYKNNELHVPMNIIKYWKKEKIRVAM